jgi:trans-aconitate 2-methyltransferase
MAWDVERYEQFRSERARPFFDLLARVPDTPVRHAVDLGCGTGELTQLLCARWPDAEVVGVDSSPQMLAAAGPRAAKVDGVGGGRLRFVQADLASYTPLAPLDLVISNAALHWVDRHEALLDRLAGLLAPGGSLAVQMPANFDAASHVLLAETAADGPWAERLAGALRQHAVRPLPTYVEQLLAAGLTVDAWETVYLHLLSGDDPVLAWLSATALRPVLALLEPHQAERFTAEYGARLRAAYPRTAHGTLFPFRRIFFVARRA